VSFRGRLTLFFLLIVVLPMVAVAVFVVQVTQSSRSGKADARLAAGLYTARTTYADDVKEAQGPARRIARDPDLAAALRSHDARTLDSLAARFKDQQSLGSVVIRGSDGRILGAAGPRPAFAASGLRLRDPASDETVGTLVVSATTAERYLTELQRLTGGNVAVTDAAGAPVASTTSLAGASLPAAGHSGDVTVAGQDLRAATVPLPGPAGFRLTLFGPEASGGFLSSSPLVVAFLIVFFAVALVFVVMLLRALGGQVGAMLGAAQRIGEGDFTRKVPVVGRDEMAGLASEFNKMSDRLATQMDELRRQRDELQRSVRRIGEAFASGFDRQALLAIVAETAVEAAGAEYGRIAAAGGEVAEVGGRPSGKLREAVQAAETRAERDGVPAEAKRENAHAMASNLRQIGDGAGAAGVMTIARVGAPFTAGERDVFLYLVGQASASIENVALHEMVSAQAVTDELTGISNSRRFREWIENEGARAKRFGHELSLLMLDLDDFKQINDTHGHLQGDEVLRTMGKVLRSESRGVDEPARYGGEEFVVGLPETGPEGALELAERIRSHLEQEAIPKLDGGKALHVTASVGVASLPQAASEVNDLVAAADAALYAAKRGGKNQVVVAPTLPKRRRADGAARPKGRAPARRK
jgi:diguanylate cyclase (GGDEF)-like protein